MAGFDDLDQEVPLILAITILYEYLKFHDHLS